MPHASPVAPKTEQGQVPTFQPFVPASESLVEFTFKAVGLGAIFGIVFGASGILYAILVGTGTIGPFQSVGHIAPFLHQEGVAGKVGTALLFLALAVIVARAAQKKPE